MLPASVKTIKTSLNGMKPPTASVRQSKVRTPTIEKKGAELKCSAPLGPLPRLTATKSGSSSF